MHAGHDDVFLILINKLLSIYYEKGRKVSEACSTGEFDVLRRLVFLPSKKTSFNYI